MEGNPVWSLPDYSHYVVSALPHLKVLDQQEITAELRANAAKWKSTQTAVRAGAVVHFPGLSSSTSFIGAIFIAFNVDIGCEVRRHCIGDPIITVKTFAGATSCIMRFL